MSFPPRTQRRPFTDVIQQGAQIQGSVEDRVLRAILGARGLEQEAERTALERRKIANAEDVQEFNQRMEEERRKEEAAFNEIRIEMAREELSPLKGITDKDVEHLFKGTPEQRATATRKILQSPGGPDRFQKVFGSFAQQQSAANAGRGSRGTTLTAENLQALARGMRTGRFDEVTGSVPAGTASTALQGLQNVGPGGLEQGRNERFIIDQQRRVAEMENDARFRLAELEIDNVEMIQNFQLNTIAAGAAMQQRFQDMFTSADFPSEAAQRAAAMLSIRYQDQIPEMVAAMRRGEAPASVNDWVINELAKFGLDGRPGNRQFKKAVDLMSIDTAERALTTPGYIESHPNVLPIVMDNIDLVTTNQELKKSLEEYSKRILGDRGGKEKKAEERPSDNAFKDEGKSKMLGESEAPKKTGPTVRRGVEIPSSQPAPEVQVQKLETGDAIVKWAAKNPNPTAQQTADFLNSQQIRLEDLDRSQQERVVKRVNEALKTGKQAKESLEKSKKRAPEQQRKNKEKAKELGRR